MRRVNFLLKRLRRETGNEFTDRYSDYDMLEYLNYAQRAIHKVIFNTGPDGGFYSGEYITDIVANQEIYTLPSDIFSPMAVYGVHTSFDSGEYFFPMNRASSTEGNTSGGYSLYNGKLLIKSIFDSGYTSGLKVLYEKALPTLSYRAGKVASYTGTTITLDVGHKDDIDSNDDYICIVDRDGSPLSSGVYIESFDDALHTITVESGLSIPVGSYVVTGRNASSHPSIPDALEDMLIIHSKRSVFHSDSSSDVNNQASFNTEERGDIEDLFYDQCRDGIQIPMRSSELDYV